MRTPFRAPAPTLRPPSRPSDFQPARYNPTQHTSLTTTPAPRPPALSEDSDMPYAADVGAPTRDPADHGDSTVETQPLAEKPAPRRPTGEHSFIDRHSTIEGTLRSAKDLRIEGRVEGEIVCDGKLTIAEGAVVQARIEAAEVIVSGSVEGDVHSHGQFKLQPSGVIRGSTTAARIAIEDGATYEGELHMTSGAPQSEDVADTPLSGVLAASRSGRARANDNGA